MPPKKVATCDLDKAIKLAFLFKYNLLPNYNFDFNYVRLIEYSEKNNTIEINSISVDNNKKLILLCILAYIHPCKTKEDEPKIKRLIQSLPLIFSDYLTRPIDKWLTKIFCELFEIQECDQVKGGVKKSIDDFYTQIIEPYKDTIKLEGNSDFIQYKNYIESKNGSLPDPEGKKAYLNQHYQAQMKFMTDKEQILMAMNGQIEQINANIRAIETLLSGQQTTGASPTGYLSAEEIQSAREKLAGYIEQLGGLTQQKGTLITQLQKYDETMNQIYNFDQQLEGILTTLKPQGNGIPPGGAGGHLGGSKRKRSESSTRRTTTVKKSSLKRIYKNKK